MFDLQFKKINFIMSILKKHFPRANEESLKWLSF